MTGSGKAVTRVAKALVPHPGRQTFYQRLELPGTVEAVPHTFEDLELGPVAGRTGYVAAVLERDRGVGVAVHHQQGLGC